MAKGIEIFFSLGFGEPQKCFSKEFSRRRSFGKALCCNDLTGREIRSHKPARCLCTVQEQMRGGSGQAGQPLKMKRAVQKVRPV